MSENFGLTIFRLWCIIILKSRVFVNSEYCSPHLSNISWLFFYGKNIALNLIIQRLQECWRLSLISAKYAFLILLNVIGKTILYR